MNKQQDKDWEKENHGEEADKKMKNKKKKVRITGEKKFYMLTAIGCAFALVAIIAVAIAASVSGDVDDEAVLPPNNSGVIAPAPDEGDKEADKDNEQVVVTPEGMTMPMKTVSLLNEHEFYHNKTLNSYYFHKGVDFAAEVGAEVVAVDDGVVESVYKSDLLLGTEIVVKHEDGLKSVYRFVNEVEGLKAGDSVARGQVIATVAEANGNEYKDGAHLHCEILKDGASVDPATSLTLEEK